MGSNHTGKFWPRWLTHLSVPSLALDLHFALAVCLASSVLQYFPTPLRLGFKSSPPASVQAGLLISPHTQTWAAMSCMTHVAVLTLHWLEEMAGRGLGENLGEDIRYLWHTKGSWVALGEISRWRTLCAFTVNQSEWWSKSPPTTSWPWSILLVNVLTGSPIFIHIHWEFNVFLASYYSHWGNWYIKMYLYLWVDYVPLKALYNTCHNHPFPLSSEPVTGVIQHCSHPMEHKDTLTAGIEPLTSRLVDDQHLPPEPQRSLSTSEWGQNRRRIWNERNLCSLPRCCK